MMSALTSVIVTPATTRNLVTLDDVREQLQIRPTDTAHDAWLAKVIARASKQAERYCDRIFPTQTYLDTWMAVSGQPGAPLALEQAPIITIAALTVDGNDMALPSTDYLIDANPAHLYWRADASGWMASSGISIQYTAGFDEIPDDVQQAVIELCVMEFRARGRDPMLRERDTPGLGREMFWVGPPPGGATALPGDIAALLDPYRRGLIG